MFFRAALVWLLLLVVAILNGTIREALISPRSGASAAHVINTVMLCVFIAILSWFLVPWIAPRTPAAWGSLA